MWVGGWFVDSFGVSLEEFSSELIALHCGLYKDPVLCSILIRCITCTSSLRPSHPPLVLCCVVFPSSLVGHVTRLLGTMY